MSRRQPCTGSRAIRAARITAADLLVTHHDSAYRICPMLPGSRSCTRHAVSMPPSAASCAGHSGSDRMTKQVGREGRDGWRVGSTAFDVIWV